MSPATDPDVRFLQAAGDPVRLSILRQLAITGPVCACEFVAMHDVSQPTVSHHLKVLREAGWISGERRGTWIWYSIRMDALERFARVLGQLTPADPERSEGSSVGQLLPVLSTT